MVSAPTNLTASPGTTVVSLSWDDADTEDGYRVLRERILDDGTEWPTETVAELAANTTSYDDDTVQPDTTYRYRIEAFTDAGDTATSDPETATTGSLGIPRRRIPDSGWYVEIDHPNTSTPLTPRIFDEPRVQPGVNGYPELSIPVPKDQAWRESAFEDAPMHVWKDGDRQAVDQLEDVAIVDDRMELRGRGGLELRERIQAEYEFEEIHVAAENLLSANTGYQLDITTPTTSITQNVRVQEASTDTELDRLLLDRRRTDAYHVDNGVKPRQSCWTTEGEAFDDGNTTSTSATDENNSSYSDGTSAPLYRGPDATGGPDYAEWVFNLGYTIPAAEFGVQVRDDSDGANGASEFQWYLIHDNGNRYNMDSLSNLGAGLTLSWTEVALEGSTKYDLEYYEGPDLTPGTYRLGVEITNSGGNVDQYGILVDAVAPYDNRFSYFFDDDNGGSGGYLDGPEHYPDAIEAPMDDAETSEAVVGATIDVDIDDTGNNQALALSNDLGDSYTSGPNTSTFTHDFVDRGPTVRGRLTLSRWGSRTTATPQTGFKPQTVSAVRIDADLEDMPMVINRAYDAQLIQVLQSFADEIADFAFSFDYSTEPPTIQFVQAGDREQEIDPDLLSIDDRKTTRDRAERAVIRGSSQDVTGDRIEASHGNAVALAETSVLESSETVRDPDTEDKFSRGEDYAIDYEGGTITAKASGRLGDGEIYAVDYRFKPKASHTADGVTDPVEVVQDAPAATTVRGCGQIARKIVESFAGPQREVQVSVPPSAAGAEAVEAIAVAGLEDGGETMQIRDIRTTTKEMQIDLGTRERIEDVVQNLNDQIRSLGERV